MSPDNQASRREFLGALGAGVATAGTLATTGEATAQTAAPLEDRRLPQSLHGSVLDAHQHGEHAAGGASGLGEDQRQPAEPASAARFGRERRHRGARDQHADRLHRGRRRQSAGRRPAADQRSDGRVRRQELRQALRARDRRRLLGRRRRARTHPGGTRTRAARRLRRKRQGRPPARRQGDAAGARRRQPRSACRCSCIRRPTRNCTSGSRAAAGSARGSRAPPSTARR